MIDNRDSEQTKLEQRRSMLTYEIASLINDDPLSAPVLIEELVDIMFDEQIDHIEDVIVNHFGVETVWNSLITTNSQL